MQKYNKIENWIFDFDDTLFFTNRLNAESYSQAIEKVVKKSVSKDLIYNKIKEGEIFPELLYGLEINLENSSFEKVKKIKNEIFESKIDCIEKNEKIFNFIEEYLTEKTFHIWTNSNRHKVAMILKLHNCHNLFETITSRDDVIHPKPNLEGLEIIEQRNSINIKNMIIIDDNEINIMSLAQKGYIAESPKIFN